MSLFMLLINRTSAPAYPRCSVCRHVADPHDSDPGSMCLHLSVNQTHGRETTPHEWICPTCDHTAPLSTDNYAPETEPRRCRRWYCRFAWNVPPISPPRPARGATPASCEEAGPAVATHRLLCPSP